MWKSCSLLRSIPCHFMCINGKKDHWCISYIILILHIYFLYSAQVSQVYYWPNIETNMAEKDKRDHVDAIFTESYVVAATYVPTIDDVRKMQILDSNRRAPSDAGKIESVLDTATLQRFNLGHLKEKELEEYKNTLSTAEDCFKHLASCKDEEIIILEDKESTVKKNCEYTHALQLCDLLASRSGK